MEEREFTEGFKWCGTQSVENPSPFAISLISANLQGIFPASPLRHETGAIFPLQNMTIESFSLEFKTGKCSGEIRELRAEISKLLDLRNRIFAPPAKHMISGRYSVGDILDQLRVKVITGVVRPVQLALHGMKLIQPKDCAINSEFTNDPEKEVQDD